ncbi:hypothetical protein AMK17_32415 [Streptomyces sp. CB00072]|nr:hypothetical protein AMK17_32415 [Streptomyces sp. CB00072]
MRSACRRSFSAAASHSLYGTEVTPDELRARMLTRYQIRDLGLTRTRLPGDLDHDRPLLHRGTARRSRKDQPVQHVLAHRLTQHRRDVALQLTLPDSLCSSRPT